MRTAAVVFSLLLLPVSACADGEISFRFGPAPRDYGFLFFGDVAIGEGQCTPMTAAGGELTFPADDRSEVRGTGTFRLEVVPDCAIIGQTVIDGFGLRQAGLLLISNVTEELPATWGPATDVDFTTFDRGFDDDDDGFSNYVEWADGVAFNDAAITPADRTPDVIP